VGGFAGAATLMSNRAGLVTPAQTINDRTLL
jgi:hypothetical protein